VIKRREEDRTMGKYLTVDQAAEYLNTSPRFIRRLVADRRIVFYKVGAHVRIAVEDLDAFVQAGRVEAITLASVRRDLGGVA
jgi:excisionase family DNA binding protein